MEQGPFYSKAKLIAAESDWQYFDQSVIIKSLIVAVLQAQAGASSQSDFVVM